MQHEQSLTFDRYRLDLPNEQIWQGNQLIALTSKAFAVLRYLVEHPGRLVTKAELFDALWPGTAVSDGALTFCIVELRKALGDNAKAPRFIETVHRRGYRFLPAVTTTPLQGTGFGDQGSVREPRTKVAHRPEHAVSAPTPGPRTPSPVLVGREAELAQLHTWLAKALNGARRIVFVTGEPGIGKTTLIDAFLQSLASSVQSPESGPSKSHSTVQTLDPRHQTLDGRWWVAVGQCIEHYGPGEPYLPVLDALGRLCRGPDGQQIVTLLHQHAPTWLVQMPALLEATAREALRRTTDGVTQGRMLRELAEALEVLTVDRPLVLVLEDLHWSDGSTLDLLAFIARRRESARLLILGTYRPIDISTANPPLKPLTHELYAHQLATELAVPRLSESAVSDYLAQRFPQSIFPMRLAPVLAHRTGGNPLFLTTMVHELVRRSALVQGEGGPWTLQEALKELETWTPESARHVLARQQERLGGEAHRVLEAASIAGAEFSAAAVAAALETDVTQIEDACGWLAEQQQFLRPAGMSEWPDGTRASRYGFQHALYQECWHERVSVGHQQQWHLRMGKRKEIAYGEQAREIAVELAVHFEQGRDYEKAVHYLQQAGENALRRSAHQEAVAFLRKGLLLLPSLPETPDLIQREVDLQLALGSALHIAQGYTAPEAERAYARARELCERMKGAPQMMLALGGLYGFHLMRGELDTAEELAAEILRFAEMVQVPVALAVAHQMVGVPLFWRGQFAAARTHLEQGIPFYSSAQRYPRGILHPEVVSCIYRGVTLWSLGYSDQAIARCQDGLTLAHEHAQPFSLAFATLLTAWLHLQRGDVQQAQEHAERLIVLSVDWAFPFWEAVGTVFRGWLDVVQGHLEEGIVLMRQGIATHQAMGIAILYPASLATLAEAYGKAGNPAEGLQVLPEALTVMTTTGQRHWEAEVYRLKSELTLQQFQVSGSKFQVEKSPRAKVRSPKSKNTDPRPLTPDPHGEAEACFLKAIEVSRHQQAKSLELRATMSLARLWQQQGKQREAHAVLGEIYHWFTEGFDTKDLQEAKALLVELRD